MQCFSVETHTQASEVIHLTFVIPMKEESWFPQVDR